MSATADVTLERMRTWLHQRFRVVHPGIVQDLQLVGALELPRHRPGVAEKFSLVFSGPASRGLPQRIYTLEHHAAGRFDLFLVPVAEPEPGLWHYEAVFNREVPPSSPALPSSPSIPS